MLIIGVIPTPPAIIATAGARMKSTENVPCGPSIHTAAPAGSPASTRPKSPVHRSVISVQPPTWAPDATVKGCSSTPEPGDSRSQMNWPGANRSGRPSGRSTSVHTASLSNRTASSSCSLDATGRISQR